jgi:plasmid maintenance system antidote protein VapI
MTTNNRKRLNPETVQKIREDYATGDITQTRLAARYHVHKNTVYKIVTGQIWAEAGGKLVHKRKDHLKKMLDNKKFKQAKLTESDIIDIRTGFAAGITAAKLADRYGITKFTISSIVNGKSWKHVGGPITSGKGRGGRRHHVEQKAAN